MKTYKLIALTGSICSGKSTVAKELEKSGAFIIDADVLAKEVVMPGTKAYQKIIEIFGKDIALSNGELNRKLLAEKIFTDIAAKKQLEAIIHPEVRKLFENKLTTLPKDTKIVVYVIPLLFESGQNLSKFDAIITVTASKKNLISRIIKRDQVDRTMALKKLSAQLSSEEKAARSDYVIENNGNPEELQKSIEKLRQFLL